MIPNAPPTHYIIAAERLQLLANLIGQVPYTLAQPIMNCINSSFAPYSPPSAPESDNGQIRSLEPEPGEEGAVGLANAETPGVGS